MRGAWNVFLKEKMNRLLGKAGIAALTAIMVCTSGMKSNAQGVVSQNASEVEEKGYSRSWTQGTKIGASYTVKSGKYEKIEAFIPAVKTAGKIKYRVYMDSNPGNVFYEYGRDLNAMYAPVSNGIYIKSSSAK